MSKLSSMLKKLLPQSLERTIRSFRDTNLRKYNNVTLPSEIYNQNHYASISFCTTCMNRLFHLKHTMEKNIKDNMDYPKVEFVLIDYNSQDNLEEYAKKNLTKYIESGFLNYYKTYEPHKFHASKAKNLAHALAKSDIVCNVDGDNFIGKDFAFYLNYIFNQKGKDNIYQFHKPPYWGTVGRLALYKENFMALGGYDENLLPIGHEDADLINRGKKMGFDYIQDQTENFQKYLSNTTLEKAVNCTDDQIDYYQLQNSNIQLSNKNIEAGLLKANSNGMENFVVYKNFQKEPLNSNDLIYSNSAL